MNNKITETINGVEYSYFNFTRSKILEFAISSVEVESFVGRQLLLGVESAHDLYGAVLSARRWRQQYFEYDDDIGDDNLVYILDLLRDNHGVIDHHIIETN